jgi:hypothetical protein
VNRATAGALLAFALISGAARGVFAQSASDLDPRIVQLVGQVSEDRLTVILRTLETFGTRNTMSSVDTPGRGIGAARQWIFDQMRSYSPRLQVSYDTYRIAKQGRITRDVEARNIVTVLPGRTPRRIYISGHYDTVAVVGGQTGRTVEPRSLSPSRSPCTGAGCQRRERCGIDDGAGECSARAAWSSKRRSSSCVMSRRAGTHGRETARAEAAGTHEIDAVHKTSFVGNDRGGNGVIDGASVAICSGPEDSASRLARYVQRWGGRYVPSHPCMLSVDRFLRGGDRTAYNRVCCRRIPRITQELHAPARRAIRSKDCHPRTRAQNAPDALWRRCARPACAGCGHREGPADHQRAPSGYDAHLQWKASPGALAYRIFWREAWGPDWQHEMLVGNVTEMTLPNTLIDDLVFGVAAVGASGHESLVSPYIAPMSTAVEAGDVKTVPQ